MTLDLAFDNSAAIKALAIAAGATRHVRATVERDRPGPDRLEITASAGSVRLARTLPVAVSPTGVLEGTLVSPGGGAATARVRVTTGAGRYLPPEAHTYGLILKMFGPEHDQVARRWFYGEGRFRVRAPAGPIRISIRKGLEFRNLDLDINIPAGATVRKSFTIERWIDMSARGWRSADVHLHYFDPPTVRWEMEAEDLAVTNILVMNQRGAITAREYFTGALDPISDDRHLVYYNEEFRNGSLGHLILLNLKRVVEPISTGRLGTAHPQLFRGAHFDLLEDASGRQGSPASPDRLLVEAMRETHRQGGLVGWAHLRDELEFALDAALGELDTVDILTDTHIPQTFTFWYHLLNCGFRIPITAGSDRSPPHIPIGHQRVYTRIDPPLSYDRWIEAIRRGASFVTNGPMLVLMVDGAGPGSELDVASQRTLHIQAQAESQLPFEHLEIVVNGRVVHSAPSGSSGRRAKVEFDLPVKGPAWIAARALGALHPEIIFYPRADWTHPVVAHTSPVWIRGGGRLALGESAEFMLQRVLKLEAWARDQAYFGDEEHRRDALATIQRGIDFYRQLARQ